MSLKAEKFIDISLFAFCLLNTISLAYGDCVANLPEKASLRPRLLLQYGTRKIEIPLSEEKTDLLVFDGQEIEAQCDTNFEYDRKIHIIKLKCEDDYLKINNDYYGREHYRFLRCSSQRWSLYETLDNFTWCPSNTTSYLLAKPKDSDANELKYLAGICYDTFNLSFKSLYYTMSPKHSEHLEPTSLAKLYEPILEMQHVEKTFGTKIVTETDYEGEAFIDWIKYSQYNYSSIAQNLQFLNELNSQLGSMLDIAWWPSLRLGNWKRYESALTEYVESEQQFFDIISGVSSAASVPITEACQTNYTLKQLIDKRNNRIPLYVWSYLRPTSNNSEEIVIIAINSPFYEFYEKDDIVFCEDKCQEIPWLQKVSTTFRYSALGVIFCCSPEDVRLSSRLDGFPKIAMNSKPQIPIQTVYEKPEETTVQFESPSYD